MKIPEFPLNERERLRVLRSYQILDTSPEDEFDQITLLASQICKCPISIITFLDSDRQWFKSKQGLEISQTPRDFSFCAHTILEEDVFVIPDTSKDERFLDNPFVVNEPYVRYYAGAPLVSYEGHKIGALCVIDITPKKITYSQKSTLKFLSNQVMKLLELKLKTKLLLISFQEIESATKLIKQQKEKLVAAGNNDIIEKNQDISQDINASLDTLNHTNTQTSLKIEEDELSKNSTLKNIQHGTESRIKFLYIMDLFKDFSRNIANESLKKSSLEEILENVFLLTDEKLQASAIKMNICLDVSLPLEFQCKPYQVTFVLMKVIENSIFYLENFRKKKIRIFVNNLATSLEFYIYQSGIKENLDSVNSISHHAFKELRVLKELIEGQGGFFFQESSDEISRIHFLLMK